MDKENGQGEIIVCQAADGLTRVDVRFEGDTVWLTQAQLVDLYHSSKANISEHIKHILEEGELTEAATVWKFRTVQMEGSRQVSREIRHYNLDTRGCSTSWKVYEFGGIENGDTRKEYTAFSNGRRCRRKD